MSRSTHQAIAAWGLGIVFSAFLVAVFWGDDQIAQWKQPILALFASLLAGLFGFFIMGSTKLVAEANWSGVTKLTFQAGGAAAFFGIVFLGWSHLVPDPDPNPATQLSGNNTTNTRQGRNPNETSRINEPVSNDPIQQFERVLDLERRNRELEERNELLFEIIKRLVEPDRQRTLSES